jgi:hypothetical protein
MLLTAVDSLGGRCFALATDAHVHIFTQVRDSLMNVVSRYPKGKDRLKAEE